MTKRLDDGALFISMILFLIFIATTSVAFGQIPNLSVDLQPTKFPFQPKEYFVHHVTNELAENELLGTVIYSRNNLTEKRKVILKGGVQRSISTFINHGSNQKNNLRPIIVKVKELKISETMQGGLINGSVQITISYEILRDSNPVKLVEYKGGTRYTRSANQERVVETVINKTLVNALHYFDKWMNREVSANEKLAEKVSIRFNDFQKQLSNDTLFYAHGRNLQWSDFKSLPDMKSRFAAEIFPFFSFDESSKMDNGEIKVNLNLKVYLVRSFSWVKGFAQNSYTLNHEQRHFDMVKIAAEKFKENIAREKLTVDNYQGIISFEYLESLREMNRMQLQYDEETKHGTDPIQQDRWNRIIEDKLQSST